MSALSASLINTGFFCPLFVRFLSAEIVQKVRFLSALAHLMYIQGAIGGLFKHPADFSADILFQKVRFLSARVFEWGSAF